MKVFVFGAGASKGSQPSNPATIAPLVNELFDYQKYEVIATAVGSSDVELSMYVEEINKSGLSLEAWLTKTWEEAQNKKTQKSKDSLLTMFGRITLYIWRLMQEVSETYNDRSAYRAFLNKLTQKDVDFGLISFNYDTLLDRAIVKSLGSSLRSLDDYTKVDYCKPHGSINWFLTKRQTDPGVDEADIITLYDFISGRMYAGDPISIESLRPYQPQFRGLNDKDFLSRYFVQTYGYPLILLPLTRKMYGFVDGFHERVIKDAKNLVAQAGEIYLIGYRAADDIMNDILRATKEGTKLSVVNPVEAEEISKKVFGQHAVLEKGSVIPHGFAEFVKDF